MSIHWRLVELMVWDISLTDACIFYDVVEALVWDRVMLCALSVYCFLYCLHVWLVY